MTGRRDLRRGVSLIETLVVTVILGIVAVLVIAGVQQAREAARRANCSNNLRQIGLAMSNYIDVIRTFPMGNNGGGYSVHAMLLPYLEQKPLYDACNFSLRGSTLAPPAQNATVYKTTLAVFLCPSDGLGPGESIGRTNYAGNRGVGVQRFGYNGAFAAEWRGAISLADFTDGTSSTAAMSEWILGPSRIHDRDPSRATFETPGYLTKSNEFDAFVDACARVDTASAGVNRLGKGMSWLRGEFSFTLYNHTMPINGRTCTNGTAVQEGAWTAGSRHGGAHVLYADGHARFHADRTALGVWRAIGSRDGGEVLPAEFP